MNHQQYHTITDNELLNYYYNSKNNKWLGILLQRYTLLLLGTCMKYLKNEEEAKDAVQQIFLKAIGELEKYKVDYFKSWIYMVAKNHCLMKLRDKHIFTDTVEDITITADDINFSELWQHEKNLLLMQKCLKELNEEQQTCISLFYLHKKTYQQIADVTNYTIMQVKSHIQNGKRNLKMMMQRKMNNE